MRTEQVGATHLTLTERTVVTPPRGSVSQPTVPRLELTTVRGIACCALVAYHVVGPTHVSGMHLPDSSAWHRGMSLFDFFRMPLFSVLSGYFYARHRVTSVTIGEFYKKKAARLGVPLLFITTVMFLLRSWFYDDSTSYLRALLFHYQHLWFIQALILIFIVIALWDAVAPASWQGLCIAAFLATMIARSIGVTQFFSLAGALSLAPFFLFGMILKVQPALLRRADLLTIAAWVAGTVMVLHQLALVEGGTPVLANSVPAVLCGFSAAYLMFALCPRVRLLETIGGFSYTIYLWHPIAASAVRQVVRNYVELATPLEFLLLFIVGLLVPIAIHLTARRIPVLCLLVAGIRKPVMIGRGWHADQAVLPRV